MHCVGVHLDDNNKIQLPLSEYQQNIGLKEKQSN